MAQQSIQIVIPVAVTVNIKGGAKYDDQEIINSLRLRSIDTNIKIKGLTLPDNEPAEFPGKQNNQFPRGFSDL